VSLSNLLLMWKCLCEVVILLDKHACMLFQGSCQTSTEQLVFGWKDVVRVFVNTIKSQIPCNSWASKDLR